MSAHSRNGRAAGAARPASPPPSRRGVVFSTEALMAAMLLFAVLLLLGNLTGPIRAPKQPLLEEYAQDILQIGAENGSWVRTSDASLSMAQRDDTAARALIESLPPGVCAQAEVFQGGNQMGRANWSYVRTGCLLRADTPVIQRIGMVGTPTPVYYWVRIKTYPREG